MNQIYRIAIAALSVTIASQAGYADQTLDNALYQMAEKVKVALAEEGFPNRVIVGDFRGSPKLRSSGGVELRRSIQHQLRAVGVTPDANARAQIEGKYKLVKATDPIGDHEAAAISIEVTLLDADDEELQIVSIKVFDEPVLKLASLTVELPPSSPPRERQQEVIERHVDATNDPETTIREGVVYASKDSPFGVELLVRDGERLSSRMPKVMARKRAFVKLHRGEEYVVRLHNSAPFEAAATVLIDGVNMFVDAKDASPDSRLIVASGDTVDVPGWYFDKRNSKAFEIGGYEESVAGRNGSGSTSIGAVTVQFRASWEPSSMPPSDESVGNAKGGKATKQGRNLKNNYQRVTRDFGVIRAVVTLRYDR